MNSSLSKREVNRQRWLERVTEWKQSGQSQKSFCEHHHLGLSSFQRWYRIFTKEEKLQAPKPVTFLPVSLKEFRPSNLSILLDDNLRIEIPAGFDPDVLKQVLRTLQTT